MRKPKYTPLLPALPGFGRKAVPLRGCACPPEPPWPGRALKAQREVPGDALELSSPTEEDANAFSQHWGFDCASSQDFSTGHQHWEGVSQ